VRKENSGGSPEEAHHFVQVVVSPLQFEWLTRQSEFLRLAKEELVAACLEEWIWRNGKIPVTLADLPAVTSLALDEFMQRHRTEFLPVD
jgi:hypothetical protein